MRYPLGILMASKLKMNIDEEYLMSIIVCDNVRFCRPKICTILHRDSLLKLIQLNLLLAGLMICLLTIVIWQNIPHKVEYNKISN
jgi:hypothetical protein